MEILNQEVRRTGTFNNYEYLNEFVNKCKIGFFHSRGGKSEQNLTFMALYPCGNK